MHSFIFPTLGFPIVVTQSLRVQFTLPTDQTLAHESHKEMVFAFACFSLSLFWLIFLYSAFCEMQIKNMILSVTEYASW